MTVKELIAILELVNPDRIVILQKDAEGNGYSPLSGVDDNAAYQPDSARLAGEVRLQRLTSNLRRQGYTDEDVNASGQPCLVLFPVN